MTLFRQVADLPLAERADHYARQQVPEALRREVESLLEFDWTRDSLRDGIESAERRFLEAPTSGSGSGPNDASRSWKAAPDRIGRFEVERLLGRGGMGQVYLARDPVIDRPVAIKLIGSGVENDTARRRLVREARTAGRLRHPNIVTIFEAGEHEEQPYIAMEFVPGETLRGLIGRRDPLPLRRRLEMIEGACAGLAHAHRAGVVHLDIKPDNLMVDDAGVVKVLDFGISRSTQTDTLTMQVAGTLRYMSPEQIQGKALDHRSDTFSLGSALFELVAYEPAFTGSTSEIVTRIAHGPPPRLADRIPGLTPELDRVLSRAMALDAAERYADIDELREALASVRLSLDPSDIPAAPLPIATPQPSATPPSSARHSASAIPAHPAGGAAATSSRRLWRPPALLTAAGIGALALAGAVQSFRTGLPTPAPERPSTELAPAAPEASPPAPAAAASAPPAAAASGPPPGDDVWRLLARGERAAVLARLENTPDVELARAVLDTVRTNVARARQAAVAGGGTDAYQDGEAQMARATRLSSGGRTAEALRALWQAGDLYAKAVPAPAAAAPPSQIPARTPAQIPAHSPAPSAASGQGPTPTASTPPPNLASAPPAAATTAPVAPATAPPRPTAAVTAPERPAAVPAPGPSDSQAVLDTLRRYDAAFEALDIAAVQRVFPSLGRQQVDELRRTFDGMSSYEIDTRAGRVDVAGDTATVQATVARRMAPRIGAPIANEVDMRFRLRRAGADWVIVAVEAR